LETLKPQPQSKFFLARSQISYYVITNGCSLCERITNRLLLPSWMRQQCAIGFTTLRGVWLLNRRKRFPKCDDVDRAVSGIK
jgi:hypothetical protein